MAIKYNGRDLVKRIINGREVEKVIYNGFQIWPESTPVGNDYLCFTANTSNSTVMLRMMGAPIEVTLETSTDRNTRTTYTLNTAITLSNVGDKVYFRNTSTTDTGFSIDTNNNYYKFVMTGSIAGSGDVTYLLNKNGTNTLSECCFCRLFDGCEALTVAPNLPATTLAQQCYESMFEYCTALTTAPQLPATTLAFFCYGGMFEGCTALTTVPSLPATTLADLCYGAMFYECTSLTTLPSLPATTLAFFCYNQMFEGCTNIKISEQQVGDYQTPYRIPTSGTGTTGTSSLGRMFDTTGGTFTGTPSINTTYYTSNTVI